MRFAGEHGVERVELGHVGALAHRALAEIHVEPTAIDAALQAVPIMQLESAVRRRKDPAIHVLDRAADMAAKRYRNSTGAQPRLDGALGGDAVLGIIDAAFVD